MYAFIQSLSKYDMTASIPYMHKRDNARNFTLPRPDNSYSGDHDFSKGQPDKNFVATTHCNSSFHIFPSSGFLAIIRLDTLSSDARPVPSVSAFTNSPLMLQSLQMKRFFQFPLYRAYYRATHLTRIALLSLQAFFLAHCAAAIRQLSAGNTRRTSGR